jgi:hypothetical protein
VPGLEADHSSPSSAEVNNECIYNSILLCRHGVCTKDKFDMFLKRTIRTSHGGIDELKRGEYLLIQRTRGLKTIFLA